MLTSGLIAWLIMNYLPLVGTKIFTALLALIIGLIPMFFILKRELLQLLKL